VKKIDLDSNSFRFTVNSLQFSSSNYRLLECCIGNVAVGIAVAETRGQFAIPEERELMPLKDVSKGLMKTQTYCVQ
jgi:hypothetical protein